MCQKLAMKIENGVIINLGSELLKRCNKTEMRWNKKLPSRSSSERAVILRPRSTKTVAPTRGLISVILSLSRIAVQQADDGYSIRGNFGSSLFRYGVNLSARWHQRRQLKRWGVWCTGA